MKSDVWAREGKWFRVPLKTLSNEGCCDCGLVHTVQFKIVNGRLYQRAWRNEAKTASGRREHEFKFKKEVHVWRRR